ncbi:transcription factor HES-3 [Pelobates cultripes]|uniref:Transcription factor HES-3 n=1 Tax=Pelobates cultripes TaxID=61616 RepID=A0AAD1T5M7_PELCU|nr:transcription factor HES-3 [Pelobates cultripes]
MVTTSEAQNKTSTCNFRKVSKPLMEKKRRARINVSLEQLKTLLENNFSQNIRKRKLEKADILELTVKYLKTLQNSVQGVPLFKSAEYQNGEDRLQRCNLGTPAEIFSVKKVSKPLMEKKRRARINVSLEQLKTLLENNFSQNIRKRKLEKADILELTVKYLKTLQNSVQGCVPLFKSAEYQAGFTNCLYSVSQFLMKSEDAGHTVSLDLARILPTAKMPSFSTMDSNLKSAQQRTVCSVNQKQQSTHSPKISILPKVSTLTAAPLGPTGCQSNSNPNSALSAQQCEALLHIGSTDQNIWRPW